MWFLHGGHRYRETRRRVRRLDPAVPDASDTARSGRRWTATSVGEQTGVAEHVTRPFDLLVLRRPGLGQGVRDTELLPFVLAQLVERQHVNPVHVPEVGGKPG